MELPPVVAAVILRDGVFELDLRASRCDFCDGVMRSGEAFFTYRTDGTFEVINQDFGDGEKWTYQEADPRWAACLPCSRLIEEDDRDGLLARHETPPGPLRAWTSNIQAEFFRTRLDGREESVVGH